MTISFHTDGQTIRLFNILMCYSEYILLSLQIKSHTSSNFTLDLIYQEIVDRDDCGNNQCAEGSTCVDVSFDYTCQCPEGTSGQFCEGTIHVINEFSSLNFITCEQCLIWLNWV